MEDNNQNQFGMTAEDLQNNRWNTIFAKIKYYLQKIEPVAAKILNATLYYSMRFIKAAVTSVMHMIMGKEV